LIIIIFLTWCSLLPLSQWHSLHFHFNRIIKKMTNCFTCFHVLLMLFSSQLYKMLVCRFEWLLWFTCTTCQLYVDYGRTGFDMYRHGLNPKPSNHESILFIIELSALLWSIIIFRFFPKVNWNCTDFNQGLSQILSDYVI